MPTAERSPLVVREYRSGRALCLCGCGNLAPIAKASTAARGLVRGRPHKYAVGHSRRVKTLYRPDPVTGCWIWQMKPGSRGYGVLQRDGLKIPAHRWVYENCKGPIPAGLDLDHLCRNKICVNPAHLEPVTQTENTRRGRSTKLTAATATAIRLAALSTAMNRHAIAEMFSTTERNVRFILSGERWAIG